MCRAITGAFAALRASGTAGLPRNLAVLHSPLLKVIAVRYWARTMRSPAGELCFAAHTRHAESEMRVLGHDIAARITNSPALTKLLGSLSGFWAHAPRACVSRAHRDLSRRTDYPHVNSSLTEEFVMGIIAWSFSAWPLASQVLRSVLNMGAPSCCAARRGLDPAASSPAFSG